MVRWGEERRRRPVCVEGERERRGERLREREREEGERIFLKVAAIYTAGCRGGW